MANKKMYALFDKQLNVYMNPLQFVNHGEAIRWLTTIVNTQTEEQKTNVTLYPEHFSLHYLGDYDDACGMFMQENKAEVIQATSVKEQLPRFTVKQLMDMLDKRYGFEQAMLKEQMQ